MYRIVIMEKSHDPYGRALEILGSYNPHSKELKTKQDRINYWIKNGAQMTPTVNNLLIEQNIIKGEKVKASIARKKKKSSKETKSAPTEAKSEEIKSKGDNPIPEKPIETEILKDEAKETPATEKKEAVE